MVERLIPDIKGMSILKVTVKGSNFEDMALIMIDKLSISTLEAKAIAQRVFPKLDIHMVILGHDYELYSSKFDRAVAHFEKNHDWDAEPNVAITFDEKGNYLCWTFEI